MLHSGENGVGVIDAEEIGVSGDQGVVGDDIGDDSEANAVCKGVLGKVEAVGSAEGGEADVQQASGGRGFHSSREASESSRR